MKVIKLNRRYRAHKVYGFSHAIRYDTWLTADTTVAERFLEKAHKTPSYQRPDSPWGKGPVNWYSEFGHRSSRNSQRPYWIYLRNEADVIMMLLSGAIKADQ
jgi:hypothetical protein